MTGPLPIFVLGIQRSGTTLLGNTLCAHPDIAGVQAEFHHGIHESVFFSHYARIFGSWSDPAARHNAVEAFLRSDYFLLTGADAEAAREVARAARTPAALLRFAMDELCAREGARAWVEKSPHHTLLGSRILADMPDARFIGVVRETASLVRSRLWAFGRRPPQYPRRAVAIVRASASNRFHARAMAGFVRDAGPARAALVRFEDLRSDPEAALDPILDRFGLAPLGAARSNFEKNSSFDGPSGPGKTLTFADRLLLTVSDRASGLVPQPVFAWGQAALAKHRPLAFPSWVETRALDSLRESAHKS